MELTISLEDPLSKDATQLMNELSDILEAITGDSGKLSFNTKDLKNDNSFFLIARDQFNSILGCGSVRQMEEQVGEIKRMYAKVPGVGTEILKDLECRANKLGYKILKLETRKVNKKAVDFYIKNGYEIIDNYGKYIGNEKAICFSKKLNTLLNE